MVRAPCFENMRLKKGPWTPEEDQLLVSYINKHGHGNWRALPKQAGLLRCGRSCKRRWINYLRPDIERGNFTVEVEGTVSTSSHNPQPPDETETPWMKIIRIIDVLDVGRYLLGLAISMGVAIVVSASSLVQTIEIHAVAISLSFAVAPLCISLLLHKIYPRISTLMLLFGYALMMLSFYALLASYLPLHLIWIPLFCCFASLILPFAMIAWAAFRTDRRQGQAP